MTHPPELEQAVAERLCEIYGEDWGDKPAWLAVAREALAMRDEAVMEAARRVRDAIAMRWPGLEAAEIMDDAALERIIDLHPALETTSAEERG